MVDIESMIKSLRLSLLKRIFSDNSGAWKKYLEYILKDSGGLMLFNCNYNVKDLKVAQYSFMTTRALMMRALGNCARADASSGKSF